MKELKELVELVTKLDLAYEGKEKFHRLGKRVCRQIADAIGLQEGSFDIRSNKGGIAVSGEVTLHGEHIYIQLSQSCFGNRDRFMYRSCRDRRDYTGGPNRWMDWNDLLNKWDMAIGEFRDAIYKGVPLP